MKQAVGREGREIRLADEQTSGNGDFRDVERPRPVENVADKKWTDPARVEDAIAVDFRLGHYSGVEVGRRLTEGENTDVVGKHRIEGPLKLIFLPPEVRFETGHLPLGMHAGIRSSGTDDGGLSATKVSLRWFFAYPPGKCRRKPSLFPPESQQPLTAKRKTRQRVLS